MGVCASAPPKVDGDSEQQPRVVPSPLPSPHPRGEAFSFGAPNNLPRTGSQPALLPRVPSHNALPRVPSLSTLPRPPSFNVLPRTASLVKMPPLTPDAFSNRGLPPSGRQAGGAVIKLAGGAAVVQTSGRAVVKPAGGAFKQAGRVDKPAVGEGGERPTRGDRANSAEGEHDVWARSTPRPESPVNFPAGRVTPVSATRDDVAGYSDDEEPVEDEVMEDMGSVVGSLHSVVTQLNSVT